MGQGRKCAGYTFDEPASEPQDQKRSTGMCTHHRVCWRLLLKGKLCLFDAPYSTYNFPVQLAIGPLIGAIAAGCTAVLKPSENAPSVAMVLEKVVAALDPDCYGCVQGGIPQSTALLDQKWDKIFYTGSPGVGKIIAKKAAETLTPVTLELGGRNPAIVTRNADIRLAARRLLWGKFFNAGQVCISQNYTLIDYEVFPGFLKELEVAMKEFYPNGAKASPDYGRIVNGRQWKRLKDMIDNSKGKILIGGTMDEAEKFLEPTVIKGRPSRGRFMTIGGLGTSANHLVAQLRTSLIV